MVAGHFSGLLNKDLIFFFFLILRLGQIGWVPDNRIKVIRC